MQIEPGSIINIRVNVKEAELYNVIQEKETEYAIVLLTSTTNDNIQLRIPRKEIQYIHEMMESEINARTE